VLSKEKQNLQEMLASPGWEVYKQLIIGENGSLRNRLRADLEAAGRTGEAIKSARAVGQIDLLETVLEVPVKYIRAS